MTEDIPDYRVLTPPKYQEAHTLHYPYIDDNGIIVIAPDCTALPDRTMVCWQGVKYVPQANPGTGVCHCGAQGEVHGDKSGYWCMSCAYSAHPTCECSK